MPEISRFYGIVIYMYFNEHQPPHFHAIYGGREALISIENLSVLSGSIPPRCLGLVVEWASLHREDLANAWDRVMNHQHPEKIEPLV